MRTALVPEFRFWSKINLDFQSGCWNWIGRKDKHGYGLFYNGVKDVRAHRFIFETIKGKVPEGLQLDHLCRNRDCVNPEHLEAVTTKENILRGEGITSKNAKKTHCDKGHLLSKNNLVKSALKFNRRACKICYDISQQAFRMRKKK